MANTTFQRSPTFFQYQSPAGLLFSSGLTDVAIFTKQGTTIWQASLQPHERPSWDGRDRFGVLVDAGSYLCRIRDQKGDTFYVPFVLIR